MHLLLIFLLFIALVVADSIPSATVTGDVPVVTSSEYSFDGPKVGGVNSTSFDWWYFDAVSEDGMIGVTIIFLRTIIFGTSPSANSVQVSLRTNNVKIDDSFSSNLSTVTTNGFGASGTWTGLGSFNGSADLSKYTVYLNTGSIKGSLTIRSNAPAHYPDGNPPGAAANVLVSPALYWTNSIPAGLADCKLTFNNQVIAFNDGVGYHDHNWGGLLLPEIIETWYWGHATVGPFSFVWFDIISRVTNTRFSSTYLVKNGCILVASQQTPFEASNNFTIVIPFGNGTDFPPTSQSNLPSSFLIEIVDDTLRWSFLANAVDTTSNSDRGFYTRWIGTISGGEVGGSQYHGSGVWEWMRFI